MAVVIETTLGDITVDLFLEQRPQACLNFLKLCKMKYYNFNLFHSIQSDFLAQTGDPTGKGTGGESIWGLLGGSEKRYFTAERVPRIRHSDVGMLSMVCAGDSLVGSQFFFTLGPELDSLDAMHCVIGIVTEGQDVLRQLNEVICDEKNRPYRDVRITHTVVLEDPFDDPKGLRAPSRSPSPTAERLAGGRIAPDEEIDETQGKTIQEINEMIEAKEAKARATILEIVGDLPDADVAPPENVLFVCKLNPVTTDSDLEIIFSRFGKIINCEIIRDKKTGDSLQYAFIEFEDQKSCENAYFKMDNVLIDDRRIHVDFSQSVSKIKYLGKGRGIRHINENEIDKNTEISMNQMRRRSRSRGREKSREPDKRSTNKDRQRLSPTRDKNRPRSRQQVRTNSDSRRSREREDRHREGERHGREQRSRWDRERSSERERIRRDRERHNRDRDRSRRDLDDRRRREREDRHRRDRKSRSKSPVNRSHPKPRLNSERSFRDDLVNTESREKCDKIVQVKEIAEHEIETKHAHERYVTERQSVLHDDQQHVEYSMEHRHHSLEDFDANTSKERHHERYASERQNLLPSDRHLEEYSMEHGHHSRENFDARILREKKPRDERYAAGIHNLHHDERVEYANEHGHHSRENFDAIISRENKCMDERYLPEREDLLHIDQPLNAYPIEHEYHSRINTSRERQQRSERYDADRQNVIHNVQQQKEYPVEHERHCVESFDANIPREIKHDRYATERENIFHNDQQRTKYPIEHGHDTRETCDSNIPREIEHQRELYRNVEENILRDDLKHPEYPIEHEHYTGPNFDENNLKYDSYLEDTGELQEQNSSKYESVSSTKIISDHHTFRQDSRSDKEHYNKRDHSNRESSNGKNISAKISKKSKIIASVEITEKKLELETAYELGKEGLKNKSEKKNSEVKNRKRSHKDVSEEFDVSKQSVEKSKKHSKHNHVDQTVKHFSPDTQTNKHNLSLSSKDLNKTTPMDTKKSKIPNKDKKVLKDKKDGQLTKKSKSKKSKKTAKIEAKLKKLKRKLEKKKRKESSSSSSDTSDESTSSSTSSSESDHKTKKSKRRKRRHSSSSSCSSSSSSSDSGSSTNSSSSSSSSEEDVKQKKKTVDKKKISKKPVKVNKKEV